MFHHSGDTITFLISDVARLVRRRYQEGLTALGLPVTEAEARALYMINRFPGCNQKTIAEYLGIEPMTLLSLLEQLEKRHFVTRSREPSDRRSKVLYVRPEAEEVLEGMKTVGRATRAYLAERIGTEDSERLRLGLAEVRAALLELTEK